VAAVLCTLSLVAYGAALVLVSDAGSPVHLGHTTTTPHSLTSVPPDWPMQLLPGEPLL